SLRQDLPILRESRDIPLRTETRDFPMKDTRPMPQSAGLARRIRITGLALAALAWLSAAGCCVGPEVRQTACDAALTDIPTEMQKVSLPPYRVEAPDILVIDMVNNIRPADDPLRAGDELGIRVSGTLPFQEGGDPVENEFKQINNIYRVQTDGTVD